MTIDTLKALNTILTIILVCDVFEQSSTCGVNAYCSDTTGEAVCLCNTGYENHVTNNGCTPVCDSYDCSGIANSSCAAIEGSAVCGCDTDFDHYFLNNGSYQAALSDYFENTEDVHCVPQFPCTVTPCAAEEQKSCLVEGVNGIPTAFCQCLTGYEDATVDDNKIEANNSAGLTCTNQNECLDATAHSCIDSQNCIDNTGSYTCSCKTGWLDNTDSNTVNSIPCIECDGIGATEFNGTCSCTAVNNATLASNSSSLCTCMDHYEESNGSCLPENVILIVIKALSYRLNSWGSGKF